MSLIHTLLLPFFWQILAKKCIKENVIQFLYLALTFSSWKTKWKGQKSFSFFIEQFYIKLSALSVEVDLKSCHMTDFSECICSFQVRIKWFLCSNCSLENGKFFLKFVLVFSAIFVFFFISLSAYVYICYLNSPMEFHLEFWLRQLSLRSETAGTAVSLLRLA